MSSDFTPGLEPIEPHLRHEEPPTRETLAVRGGPLIVAKLVEHSTRQRRAFSYRGRPMSSVSVDATVATWTLDAILRNRLWSRSSYATCEFGVLQDAGFEILPTHRAPHYDVLLADSEPATAATLLALFGAAEINPFKRGRR